MAGINKGAVYSEVYGTTSPVTGSAPTAIDDGQPMDGLASVCCVVSAGPTITLDGMGSLEAYVLDPAIAQASGGAQANGGSGVATTAFLAYDAQSGNFTVGLVATGTTSGATGTISADTDAGTTGVLTLTGVTGAFLDNEAITDTSTGAAVVNGLLYKTLAYDNQTVAFAVGMTVSGLTSRATGVISIDTGSVLTFPYSTFYGVFVDNEALVGVAPPRWSRARALDVVLPSDVTATRDIALAPVTLTTPRKGRVKWIPVDVSFSSGSAGVTVSQLGQTNAGLHDAGKWGG